MSLKPNYKFPTTDGIDISSNNGSNIDFKKVRASGVEFVFVKVSQGTSYVNPNAERHIREAKAAGLIVGGYHFIDPQPGRKPVLEADHFLRHARGFGVLNKGCLRPAMDSEISGLTAGRPSRRYHYKVIERVIDKTTTRPFIYTAQWFWTGVLGALNAHECPLWLASYSSGWRKLIPNPWKGVSIHQYTDKGRVPGVSTFCDLNAYLANTKHLHNTHVLKKNV